MYWVNIFIRFHGLKHPRDMGQAEIESFLTYLATERKVSVPTHRKALSALPFLYQIVLGKLDGQHKLPASLLYGSGMRWMRSVAWCDEGLQPLLTCNSIVPREKRQRIFMCHRVQSGIVGARRPTRLTPDLRQGDWVMRPGFGAKGARKWRSSTNKPLPRVISPQNRMRMAQSPCRARHLPPPARPASHSRVGPHRATTVLHSHPMNLVSFFFGYFWFSSACGGREM